MEVASKTPDVSKDKDALCKQVVMGRDTIIQAVGCRHRAAPKGADIGYGKGKARRGSELGTNSAWQRPAHPHTRDS